MNCSPPGSSVHEILQARILEWVAPVGSLRGSSQPTGEAHVSCIAGGFLIAEPLGNSCYWIIVGPKFNIIGVLVRKGKFVWQQIGRRNTLRGKMSMLRQKQKLEF